MLLLRRKERPDVRTTGRRGAEALDLLVALSTGHAGSLCTIHAGSAAEALRRLETLALMADVGLPLAAIRDQIADAIDLVVREERAPDGTRRIVEVAEVLRVAGGRGSASSSQSTRAARPGARRPATRWRGGWPAPSRRQPPARSSHRARRRQERRTGRPRG